MSHYERGRERVNLLRMKRKKPRHVWTMYTLYEVRLDTLNATKCNAAHAVTCMVVCSAQLLNLLSPRSATASVL